MTNEMQTLLLFRGHIASMPPDDQAKVLLAAAELRRVCEQFGDHGLVAFGLVSAEYAAEAD